jgi:hypothetical protein
VGSGREPPRSTSQFHARMWGGKSVWNQYAEIGKGRYPVSEIEFPNYYSLQLKVSLVELTVWGTLIQLHPPLPSCLPSIHPSWRCYRAGYSTSSPRATSGQRDVANWHNSLCSWLIRFPALSSDLLFGDSLHYKWIAYFNCFDTKSFLPGLVSLKFNIL